VVSQGLVRDTNLHSRVGGILNTSDLFHSNFIFPTGCWSPLLQHDVRLRLKWFIF